MGDAVSMCGGDEPLRSDSWQRMFWFTVLAECLAENRNENTFNRKK